MSHLSMNPELLKKENELRALNDMLNQQTHAIPTPPTTVSSSPSTFLLHHQPRSIPSSSALRSVHPYAGPDLGDESETNTVSKEGIVSSPTVNHQGSTTSPSQRHRSSPRSYQLPSSSPPPLHDQQQSALIAGERAMAALRPESQYNPGTKSPSRAHTNIVDTRSSSSPSYPSSVSLSSSPAVPSTTSKSTKPITSRIPILNKKRSTIGTTSTSSTGKTNIVSEPPTDTDNPPKFTTIELDPDLPLEMQVKVLKSHVFVARTEAQDASALASRLAMELAEARKETNNITEERQRLKRTATAAETALEKAKKAAALAEAREQELRQQITTLQKEATTSSKVAKQAESSTSAMDARLVRAQEEIDRLKSQLVTERTNHQEQYQHQKKEIETLQTALKKLERQKTELLITFKKQMKLIDILKRQRVHMEAARMLAFTEEEFAKILDVGM